MEWLPRFEFVFFERLPLLGFQPFNQPFRSIKYLTELVDLVERLAGPTGLPTNVVRVVDSAFDLVGSLGDFVG